MERKIKRITAGNKDEFITLSQASGAVDYSPGYLKNLALSGQLKAQKIGRNWHTTRAWLKEYLERNEKTRKSKAEVQAIAEKLETEIRPEAEVRLPPATAVRPPVQFQPQIQPGLRPIDFPAVQPARKEIVTREIIREVKVGPVRTLATVFILLLVIVTAVKLTRDELLNPKPEKILGEETQNENTNSPGAASENSSPDQNQTSSPEAIVSNLNFIHLNNAQSQIAQNFLGSFYLIEDQAPVRYANGDISFFPDYGLKLRRNVVEEKNVAHHSLTSYNFQSNSVTDRVLANDARFHLKSLEIKKDLEVGGDLNFIGNIFHNGLPFAGGGGGGLSPGDNISLLTNNVGYITDGNTNWNNSYGFITASSADALTNKTGNISMWTNDSGYLTSYSETDPQVGTITTGLCPSLERISSRNRRHL